VISDDIHLPTGKIRIRPGGSDGGHNGLKSISAHLKTKEYARLRFGVGEEFPGGKQIDYVLSRFSVADRKIVDENIERAVAALECWISDDLERAMNRFNG
jgi:PTH1 family peptidyl-tRNA hydrolase